VPAEAMMMIVHGEQDMHFHQPLVPGQSMATTAEAYSMQVGGSGTRFTIKVSSRDNDTREPVLDQFVTMFIRGMADGDSARPARGGAGLGPRPPWPWAASPPPLGKRPEHRARPCPAPPSPRSSPPPEQSSAASSPRCSTGRACG